MSSEYVSSPDFLAGPTGLTTAYLLLCEVLIPLRLNYPKALNLHVLFV